MAKTNFCDCGLPSPEGKNCGKCGLEIEPKRLSKFEESFKAALDSQESDDESEPYEYKHSLNKTIREGKIPFSTTFDIPGKTIKEHIAMITGVGNARFTLTGTNNRLTNRAATKALNNLIEEANRIDADAVIGVNFTIDTYGTGLVNQLVVVTGTAVKLVK